MSKQPNALRLAAEFRPSMPADVMKLWASDVTQELSAQHELIQKLKAALDDARLLSVAYSASYQSMHGLRDFHPKHKAVVDAAHAALAAAEAHK